MGPNFNLAEGLYLGYFWLSVNQWVKYYDFILHLIVGLWIFWISIVQVAIFGCIIEEFFLRMSLVGVTRIDGLLVMLLTCHMGCWIVI